MNQNLTPVSVWLASREKLLRLYAQNLEALGGQTYFDAGDLAHVMREKIVFHALSDPRFFAMGERYVLQAAFLEAMQALRAGGEGSTSHYGLFITIDQAGPQPIDYPSPERLIADGDLFTRILEALPELPYSSCTCTVMQL